MIHLSSIAVEEINPDTSLNESLPAKKAEWQSLLSKSRMTTKMLLQKVGLTEHPLVNSEAESLFELKVPQPFIDKMQQSCVDDPLLLQVLPQQAEFLNLPGYVDDPLDEAQYTPVKGVIHKYRSRVLLVTNQACAVNCRYCFRRSFPYEEHRQSKQDWKQAISYIESKPEINEVILSGGDPLSLATDYLEWLLQELDALPQIKRIRIHSRLPIVIPQRIDCDLLQVFERLSKKLIMVLHCNHANELGDDVCLGITAMRERGVILYNQSVLLKGINDNVDQLIELSERLFETGVQPYYLFLLDKVQGAGHFEVPEQQAKALYKALLGALPGFLVPKLMVEIPGCHSKSPVAL